MNLHIGLGDGEEHVPSLLDMQESAVHDPLPIIDLDKKQPLPHQRYQYFQENIHTVCSVASQKI